MEKRKLLKDFLKEGIHDYIMSIEGVPSAKGKNLTFTHAKLNNILSNHTVGITELDNITTNFDKSDLYPSFDGNTEVVLKEDLIIFKLKNKDKTKGYQRVTISPSVF